MRYLLALLLTGSGCGVWAAPLDVQNDCGGVLDTQLDANGEIQCAVVTPPPPPPPPPPSDDGWPARHGWQYPTLSNRGNDNYDCPNWTSDMYTLAVSDQMDVWTHGNNGGFITHMAGENAWGHAYCIQPGANVNYTVQGPVPSYCAPDDYIIRGYDGIFASNETLRGNICITRGPTVWEDLGDADNTCSVGPNSGAVVCNGVHYMNGVVVP